MCLIFSLSLSVTDLQAPPEGRSGADAGGQGSSAGASGHGAGAEPETEPQIPAQEKTGGGGHQSRQPTAFLQLNHINYCMHCKT